MKVMKHESSLFMDIILQCNIITINRLENNKNVSYKIIKNVMDALGLEINITKIEQPQN